MIITFTIPRLLSWNFVDITIMTKWLTLKMLVAMETKIHFLSKVPKYRWKLFFILFYIKHGTVCIAKSGGCNFLFFIHCQFFKLRNSLHFVKSVTMATKIFQINHFVIIVVSTKWCQPFDIFKTVRVLTLAYLKGGHFDPL